MGNRGRVKLGGRRRKGRVKGKGKKGKGKGRGKGGERGKRKTGRGTGSVPDHASRIRDVILVRRIFS